MARTFEEIMADAQAKCRKVEPGSDEDREIMAAAWEEADQLREHLYQEEYYMRGFARYEE